MLNFLTDTGGETLLFPETVIQLRLPLITSRSAQRRVFAAKLPGFQAGASIPLLQHSVNQLAVCPRPVQSDRSTRYFFDGMLGQEWFAHRVWTFDYLHRQLLLWEAGFAPPVNPEDQLALGFKTDASGARLSHFPRIQATIDGELLNFLFDTGATTDLTDEAHSTLDDGRAHTRAANFITASMFEKWQKQHPDWPVIEHAEQVSREAMICVPWISLANHTVGPVWFTKRPDYNFHVFMSQFMDERVEGALGGNTLRHFCITVDYIQAIASIHN
jgi:hypothetical protein